MPPNESVEPVPPFRVVIDTSVLIAFLWGHGPVISQLLDFWKKDQFELVTSRQLLVELKEVMERPKMHHHVNPVEANALLTALAQDATVVPGTLELPGAVRDPEDDKVIACAIEGDADFVVTLDPDLLSLEQRHGIQILDPMKFTKAFIAASGEEGS